MRGRRPAISVLDSVRLPTTQGQGSGRGQDMLDAFLNENARAALPRPVMHGARSLSYT
jgi:hypothetical protein